MSLELKTIPMPEEAAAAKSKHLLLRLRPLILTGVVGAIIMQIVALSPSSVEEARDTSAPIEPDALVPHEKVTLAPGIPKNQVPEYSVDQFNYVSTHESVKEWNLLAVTANFYNSLRLVHARTVTAYLYDPDGKITVVTGQEAKYNMTGPTPGAPSASGASSKNDSRDLEIFGNVKTVFPDGFEVDSEYMKYRPDTHNVEIPMTYAVTGHGKDENGQVLGFKSFGMTYSRTTENIILPRQVEVTVDKATSSPSPASASVAKETGGPTIIDSDRCIIERSKKFALFSMYPNRPIHDRYVQVHQPTLFSKGRRGELNYGDNTGQGSKLLHKMALYDDVLVKELGDGEVRYATGGQADFDGAKNTVVLTKFPQVYENEDTVTGDRITLHRDTDVVEVEHSNSFSAGQNVKDQL